VLLEAALGISLILLSGPTRLSRPSSLSSLWAMVCVMDLSRLALIVATTRIKAKFPEIEDILLANLR